MLIKLLLYFILRNVEVAQVLETTKKPLYEQRIFFET